MRALSDKQLGALGEKKAAEYLKKQGYKILVKNYKCKAGEIDIIARIGGELIFAEVKTRCAEPYVRGMYSVDARKREHIIRSAAVYIRDTDCRLQPRFDIIEVEVDRDTGRVVSVEHLPNAFMQEGPYSRY